MKFSIRTIAMLFGAAVLAASCGQTAPKFDGPAYLDESLPIDVRVEDALSRMTMEEKVKILHFCLTLCNFADYFIYSLCTYTARCTFTARFINRKFKEEFCNINHTRIFIHYDKTA